jgi:F-type H+-transporting ATPase subunit epsilon
MKKTTRCDIVSAHGEVFSGEASMVFATGVAGELGISPRHAPLITQLKPGPVRVQQPDGEEAFFFVSGGILEVQPHEVTVLTDTATRGEDLDEAAAQAAKANGNWPIALVRLKSLKHRPSFSKPPPNWRLCSVYAKTPSVRFDIQGKTRFDGSLTAVPGSSALVQHHLPL